VSGIAAREFVAPAQLAAVADLLRRARREIESEIAGTSMAATLPPGTRVRIRCGAVAPRARRTIVAFLVGARLIAHRVVAGVRGHVITRGDGAVVCDPPLAIGDVLGEVVALQAGDGWRPPPAPPPLSPARRVAARAVLLGVAAALAVDPRLARRLAVGLARLRRGGA
jgi:hypothetical protein